MTTQPQDSEIEAVALAIERADKEPGPDYAGFDHPEISDWGVHLARAAINALSMHRASLSGGGEVDLSEGDAVLYRMEREDADWDTGRSERDFEATFIRYVEGWPKLEFRDGSTAIVRPSRVRSAALTIPSSPEGGR